MSDYKKHQTTAKHIYRTNLNDLEQNVAKNIRYFTCKYCNKTYPARNSLWYHERKCKIQHHTVNEELNTYTEDEQPTDKQPTDEQPTDKQLIMVLMKENKDLQNMMMNVIKNGTHNTINHSHNKSFNLNFFLNETCKDAMNIMDFVESIKLQLSDLERVGELGYIEGISNIIVKNLF